MADNVSFKVVLKDQNNGEDNEVRRFVVDKNVSTSFAYLEGKLNSVFPQLSRAVFSISWTDEDGDLVTIDTDEELIIALTEMCGPLYKLNVNVKGTKKNEDSSPSQESQTHHGVTCDACEKHPIEGYRYKCVVCDDYDLCSSCEAAGRHPGHNMMRITNPENVFPQRLFKRIHKLQERAEKGRSRQEKDNIGASAAGQSGHVPSPHCGFQGRGRGIFRGCGMHGHRGMGGMREGCGVRAWAGPAFDAMMRGFVGEQPMGAPVNKNGENQSASHQKNHEAAFKGAQEVQDEAHNAAHETGTSASSSSQQEAINAVFEQFNNLTGSADYLKNVGNFVAQALDPFGIDVQFNIETPEGTRKDVKSSTTSKSSSSSSFSTSINESHATEDTEEDKNEKIITKTMAVPSDDEDWTVLSDQKDDSNILEVPIKVNEKESGETLYPSLPENTNVTALPAAASSYSNVTTPPTTASSSTTGPPVTAPPMTAPTTPAPPTATHSTIASPANHPDPKIQVALQAMMNMGFTNEGGWLTGLLEAKNGDIGKVLDILQPVKK